MLPVDTFFTACLAGYQAYQPVTAPAGRSYVDQRKNEYHISLTGGTASHKSSANFSTLVGSVLQL
ncbi:hypothetical protein O5853_31645, partial [Escherichia coli]|nr:hypothetical protein [Escherichia coli]